MKKRGIGIASMHFGMGNTGKPNPSSAYVEVLEDGTVIVLCGAADMGQGTSTTLAQIAAHELGVSFEDVVIHTADSLVTPEAGVSSASRQTYVSGNAVRRAAAEAKRVVFQEAANLLGAPPSELVSVRGWIYCAGDQGKKVSLKEVVASCRSKGVLAIGSGHFNPTTKALEEETGQGIPYATYHFGTQVAEVEVDTETGEVAVISITAAHDVGKAINPQAVEAQIEGGIAMGLGFSFMEEVVLQEGVVKTPTFKEYLIPTALDVTLEINPIIVEAEEPTGPFGAKGTGEPPTCPTAAAIINAIYDAVGIRIKKLPITAEQVYFALREANGCEKS